MGIILPVPSDGLHTNKHAANCFASFNSLLEKANEKQIPAGVEETINAMVNSLNSNRSDLMAWYKQLRSVQQKSILLLAKDAKLTPLNYYRNQWLAVGMGAFGVPIGVAFGLSIGNLGMLGIGLPIGMAIGMAVGANMDKKAKEEGRQLDVEIKIR